MLTRVASSPASPFVRAEFAAAARELRFAALRQELGDFPAAVYLERVERHLASLAARAEIALRVTVEGLDTILESGLPARETTDRPCVLEPCLRLDREDAEKRVFTNAGVIYGYLATPDERPAEGEAATEVDGWGPIKLVLADTVRERATVTLGDSHGAFLDGALVPAPLGSLDYFCCIPGVEPLTRTTVNPVGGAGLACHFEVQVHGPPTPTEITRIENTAPLSETAAAALDDAGITFVRVEHAATLDR